MLMFLAAWFLLQGTTALTEVPQDERCLGHVLEYYAALRQAAPWALQMLDATTKIPDGVLYGNIVQLGNFDECVAAEVPLTSSFQPRYCRAALSVSLPPQQNTTQEQLLPTIMWALCLPSTCSPNDVAGLLQLLLPGLLKPVFGVDLNITAKVSASECYDKGHEFSKFEEGSWWLVGILGFLALLTLVSTLVIEVKGHAHPVLAAFSARTTLTQVFSTRAEPGTLGCLHGIRAFTIMYIVLGHTYGNHAYGPLSNLSFFNELCAQLGSTIILKSDFGVDTFFFLSGLLVCYVFLKEMDRSKKFDIFKFYLYRYLRLTIPLIVVIFFNAYIGHSMGSGPLWNWVWDIESKPCKQNWWIHLVYMNNYFRGDYGACLVQSWYLAVDMQLSWFSPLVMLPMYYAPRAGFQIATLLLAICCFLPFTYAYIRNYPWFQSFTVVDPTYHEVMNKPPLRASPYIVGILLGYYLYTSRGKIPRLSRYLVAAGWAVSTGICLAVIFTYTAIFQTDYVYDRVESAFYNGFSRFGWSVGLSWVVFACVKGYGGPVDAILSWGKLLPLSRLSYSAFLTHFISLYYEMGTGRIPKYLNNFDVVYSFLGFLPFVFAIALVLYVLVEGPSLALLRYFFNKGTPVADVKKHKSPTQIVS